MVEPIYCLKPAWCGRHLAGLRPETGLTVRYGATAFKAVGYHFIARLLPSTVRRRSGRAIFIFVCTAASTAALSRNIRSSDWSIVWLFLPVAAGNVAERN